MIVTLKMQCTLTRVYKREEKRVYNCWKAIFVVQRSPDILLYSSYDNTLSLLSLSLNFTCTYTCICSLRLTYNNCYSGLIRSCFLIPSDTDQVALYIYVYN